MMTFTSAMIGTLGLVALTAPATAKHPITAMTAAGASTMISTVSEWPTGPA